jgi:alpha-L-fucosidase
VVVFSEVVKKGCFMKKVLLALVLISLAGIAYGSDRGPTRASSERMGQWNDWKFGLFIHWGPYAQAAPANGRIGALLSSDPEQLKKGFEWYKTFKPVNYDPAEWAKMAKEAGMRYAVFVTKHHDGFCNWDSKVTKWTITNPDCPWSKSENPDLVGEYVKAFRAEGLKVGFYFSHLNWALPEGAAVKRHPAEDPNFIKTHPKEWAKYVRIAKDQVEELLTNYGPIDILWHDIHYPEDGIADAIPMLAMSRKLQPNLIINNRGTSDYKDFQVQEQFIPDAPADEYWELNIPTTKNGGFWYKGPDAVYRQSDEYIPMFADIVHKGGNFLLNVGPMGDGSFPQGEKDALEIVGEWMKDNGEAIYGTKASPWGQAPEWGRITRKDNKLYLFVFDWKPGAKLDLELDPKLIGKAYVLKGGRKVSYKAVGKGVEFVVPDIQAPSRQVSIIAVELNDELNVTAKWPTTKRKKIHHFDSEVRGEEK